MKIGIYKPFKETFFIDDRKDNAAWSYEVVNLSHILVENGHDVYILSKTDLTPEYSEHIHIGLITQEYDRIIIFGGSFSLDQYGDNIITMLNNRTPRLDFILTDLALTPSNKELYRLFNNIYTMASRPIAGIGGVYGGLAELRTYDLKFEKDVVESLDSKTVEFYFGGTERNRLMDFLEYVWRPGHVITTKSAYLGIENRVDRDKFLELLSSAKYSICIADIECNENYFMSPRPYECFAHDIIAFTDVKFDPDGIIIPHDSYLRVRNYKEMKDKINELNSNLILHRKLLMWQRNRITKEMKNGSFVYDKIK